MNNNTIFTKGQKVMVSKHGANASGFNDYKKIDIKGIYSVENWSKCIFEIEGTVKLCKFEHDDSIYGAYLLKLDGKEVGYVYNYAIEECAELSQEDAVYFIKQVINETDCPPYIRNMGEKLIYKTK